MSYSLAFTISLGETKVGLTLNGQLFDDDGADVDDAITTGFTEIGNGNYVLSATIPDGHRGGIKIYQSGMTAIEAIGVINPEEVEAQAIAAAIFRPSMADHEAEAATISLATLVLIATGHANTVNNPNFLTVYQTDGVTEHCRIPIATDENADPIVGIG